jgi:hypothetical protein
MPNTISKIHPPIRTPYKCEKCGGVIEFEKVDIIREDGYPNWYLNVVCLCGEVTDKNTIEACYDMHRRLAAIEIKRQQNEAFANALGLDLADVFQRIAGDGL